MIGDVTHEIPTRVECTNTTVSDTAIFVIPFAIRGFPVSEKGVIRKHFSGYIRLSLGDAEMFAGACCLVDSKALEDAARRNEPGQFEEVQMASTS
jgi:hypothetical protein